MRNAAERRQRHVRRVLRIVQDVHHPAERVRKHRRRWHRMREVAALHVHAQAVALQDHRVGGEDLDLQLHRLSRGHRQHRGLGERVPRLEELAADVAAPGRVELAERGCQPAFREVSGRAVRSDAVVRTSEAGLG